MRMREVQELQTAALPMILITGQKIWFPFSSSAAA